MSATIELVEEKSCYNSKEENASYNSIKGHQFNRTLKGTEAFAKGTEEVRWEKKNT